MLPLHEVSYGAYVIWGLRGGVQSYYYILRSKSSGSGNLTFYRLTSGSRTRIRSVNATRISAYMLEDGYSSINNTHSSNNNSNDSKNNKSNTVILIKVHGSVTPFTGADLIYEPDYPYQMPPRYVPNLQNQ